MSTQNTPMSIDQLLRMALEQNETQRNSGMNTLNNLADNNLSLFLQQLGGVLSDESKPSNIRQLSAILIKNSLFSGYLKVIFANESFNILKKYSDFNIISRSFGAFFVAFKKHLILFISEKLA